MLIIGIAGGTGSGKTTMAHIEALRRGEAIEQPVYSYLTCTRQPETIAVLPRDVVIVEGILILGHPAFRALMDLRVFAVY